ncbi:hypothetical protein HY968_00535 [Candidatus Kaiserbacteria bacterium]|nr:hypothetical protein [Candidatus Kaiserbacteria bacterium]
MSWALRRRLLYIFGVVAFFGIVVGGPLAYKYFTIPPTCTDGIQNQGETAPDRGGPCPFVDERALSAIGTLWARGFRVRDGSYNAIAYVQNPNVQAGVRSVHYQFRLYDSTNVLVAEREGSTFIMPGGITPIFEGGISTGNRIAARTFFDFTDALEWERLYPAADAISVTNMALTDTATSPRITANITNTSVAPVQDLLVSVVVFDTAGNAFTASQTRVARLGAGEMTKVIFTWPDPYPLVVGRVDITPVLAPTATQRAQ